MYEEYLEDYVYKLVAKIASRMCYMFKSKKRTSEEETSLVPKTSTSNESISEGNKSIEDSKDTVENINDDKKDDTTANTIDGKEVAVVKTAKNKKKADLNDRKCSASSDRKTSDAKSDVDDDLNNLNFHVMMFFLWLCVTLVNVPVLLTWARNFK